MIEIQLSNARKSLKNLNFFYQSIKDDFYHQQNGIIFEAIVELFNANVAVDEVTLQNKLKEKGVSPEVASIEYIQQLILNVPTTVNAKNYANIVKDKAILRNIIKVNQNIENMCFEGAEEVDSILNQSYRNLEIILVDDGSPDECGRICDDYASMDSRIDVIHKENGGLSSARNAALDVAKGDWILCVDSDDYIHSTLVEKMLAAAEENSADIVISSYYLQKNNKLSIVDEIHDEVIVMDKMTALDRLVADKEIKSYAWGKLYRAELFEGVRYPDGRN